MILGGNAIVGVDSLTYLLMNELTSRLYVLSMNLTQSPASSLLGVQLSVPMLFAVFVHLLGRKLYALSLALLS
jgi:hypothetical protein